jgi:hypothetical protein
MNAELRRRFEMAVRVRDFLRAHPTEGAEAAALTHLEQLLGRVDALIALQQDGILASRAATLQRAQLRLTLQSTLLRYLARVGTVAARENPELGAIFRLPHVRITDQAFLTLARAMVQNAAAHKQLLTSRGLSEKLLDEVSAAVGEFEKSLEATRAGRREHVGATADLRAVAAEISEQVLLIDGLVRYRFGDDAMLMGSWASARNVLGPFRSRDEGDASRAA